MLLLSKMLWLLVSYHESMNNDKHDWDLYENVLWFIWITYWCANEEVNGYGNIYMNSN